MLEIFDPIFAGMGIAVSISTFGYFLDRKIHDSKREKVYEFLNSVQASSQNRLSSLFVILFDRVFDSHETAQRPSLLRSTLASLLVLVIISVLWMVSDFENVVEEVSEITEDISNVYFLCILGICINIIGDYFSFWETRIIMDLMVASKGRFNQAKLLLIDLIATMLIFFVGLALGSLAISLIIEVFNSSHDPSIPSFPEVVVKAIQIFVNIILVFFTTEALLFNGDGYHEPNILSLFFYTTMFTSVWVWSVMLGGWLWPISKWLLGWLDFE